MRSPDQDRRALKPERNRSDGRLALAVRGGALALCASLCVVPARGADEAARRVASAVNGGLAWLAEQQIRQGPAAGAWPCDNPRYQPATASLAGLAFLANGHLPGPEGYGPVVRKAMAYVKGTMAADGYLGQGDHSGMYIHAICSLFGLSYLGMSPDRAENRELAAWCAKSLAVIVKAQQVAKKSEERGGWRYTPYTQESDLSVTSWQLLVLHTARQCGYRIDPVVFEEALRYVSRAFRTAPGGVAGYLYRPGVSQEPEASITGVALFIRALLGEPDTGDSAAAQAWLARFPPAWGGRQYGGYFFFSGFYMTQGMFQVGGPAWEAYGRAIDRVLVEQQSGDGQWPFPPDNAPQGRRAGPAYATAMAVLMLSLEKQYLPMYQRQKGLFR